MDTHNGKTAVPEEVREAMIAAVIKNIGPVVGNPEYLARPGNVERLEARRRNAAASHVDAALSALEASGWVCVPVVPTTAMLNAGNDNIKYQIEEDPERSTQVGWPFASTVWAAMLTASNPKEQAP